MTQAIEIPLATIMSVLAALGMAALIGVFAYVLILVVIRYSDRQDDNRAGSTDRKHSR